MVFGRDRLPLHQTGGLTEGIAGLGERVGDRSGAGTEELVEFWEVLSPVTSGGKQESRASLSFRSTAHHRNGGGFTAVYVGLDPHFIVPVGEGLSVECCSVLCRSGRRTKSALHLFAHSFTGFHQNKQAGSFFVHSGIITSPVPEAIGKVWS